MDIQFCKKKTSSRYFNMLKGYLTECQSKALPLLKRLEEYYVHGNALSIYIPLNYTITYNTVFNYTSLHLLYFIAVFYIPGKDGRPPRFPPATWSVLDRVLSNRPSTTNFLEASHRMLDSMIVKDHPSKKTDRNIPNNWLYYPELRNIFPKLEIVFSWSFVLIKKFQQYFVMIYAVKDIFFYQIISYIIDSVVYVTVASMIPKVLVLAL